MFANEMQVITTDGENLGVLTKQQALDAAKERDLDLVLIAPKVKPPVAKILDFSKFLYDEKKKKSGSKAKKSELKELRFGPNTGEGDMKRHTERARGFLEEGHRVKLTVQMRGRENIYPNLAFEKITGLADKLSDIAKLEGVPKRLGRMVTCVIVRK
ncbi:translation initiation factor IF-3 [bacterium]|nr:translation initiation factor IF-3 [bacterium]